jgi:rhodanese-related sulfurtransferase
MSERAKLGFAQRGLAQQGYHELPVAELDRLSWSLRFTPAMCMLGAVVGLVLQSPSIHYTLALLGLLAFLLPGHHPLDLLFNYALRFLLRAPAVPPNPVPRRVACLLGGGMNLLIGISFANSVPAAAFAIGAVLIALQIVVISSHFCLASWILEAFVRRVSGRRRLLGGAEARRIVSQGGLLVDVRSEAEFARGHLPGAVNAPLDRFERHVEELVAGDRPIVLYCSAGVRSSRAARALERAGAREVHELGLMKRWEG